MAVYKEINRADGSGVTTFYRISDVLDTAETDDQEGQAVIIDYNQAQNKPSINGVTLIGNKTTEDLGLQPAGDYITNDEADEKFIDEDELESKNYVNQAELQDAIAHIEHFHREIVEALPVTGMDNVLYMVRKGGTGEDIYNEYIWVGLSSSENGYEFLGTTATDLTDYYKKSQVDAALATKVDKEGGKGLSEQNYTLAEKTKLAGLENYDDTEIQAEVSGLNTDVNNLKSSNVTISNTLAELKPNVESNTAAVSTIYDLLDNKMTAIRLVEQGDGWVWMNLEGSRLTYAQASAALGHENCMLFIEQLENDGKVIPAEYKSEGDHINVIFKDLDSLVHIMTCGEDDAVVTEDVTTTNGQTDFTIEDEAVGYTTKMTALCGDTSQDGTPTPDTPIPVNVVSGDNEINVCGKNLLNLTSDKVVYNYAINYTLEPNKFVGVPTADWARIKAKFSVEPNTDYTFSSDMGIEGASPSTFQFTIETVDAKSIYNGNVTLVNGKLIKTFNTGNNSGILISFWSKLGNAGGNITKVTYNNIQLEKGSQASTFEPYQGNTYNIDLPEGMELCKIGDYQDRIFKTSGINLFDKNNVRAGYRLIPSGYYADNGYNATEFIKVKPSTTYSTSWTMDWSECVCTYDNSQTFVRRIQSGTNFTTSETEYYIRADVKDAHLSTAQINEGSTALPYEPYGSGKWYLEKQIGNIVLNGSEEWSTNYNNSMFRTPLNDFKHRTTSPSNLVISDYYVCSSYAQMYDKTLNTGIEVGDANANYLYIRNADITTITDFKTWLSTHNTNVYYVLATPTTTEITDTTLLAQLNALEQITQYKHTYITITGANLTPEADFTYIRNIVINNSDTVLGKDTYWNDEVPTSADLPSNAQEGEIRIVQDTKNVYIYDGTNWIPFDKGGEIDLSNYLAKDNTTPWIPTGAFNPATKKYVDDSIGGVFVPTKTSQLTNDSNFIGKNSNDLTHYYTKSQTYNKSEVDALIDGGNISITVSGDTLVITTE